MASRLRKNPFPDDNPCNTPIDSDPLDDVGNWYLSGAPDSRWNDDELNTLKRLTGNEFEVVKMGPLTTQ